MLDYHVHPDYSIDADPSSIWQYCQRAAEIGIREICFTPHLEVDPVRKHLDGFVRLKGVRSPMNDLTWLDCYFKEIEEARREWKEAGLSVKSGIEVGYDLGLEKMIERVVENYPFDFVLGSVHCLDHKAISSKRESVRYFPGKEMEQVVQSYFYTLKEGVKTGLFDCVAHLDLYRRYGVHYFGTGVLRAHENLIGPLFELMLKTDTGLEINTSSLRRGHTEFHPSRAIILSAKRAGITVFTVGSDAHRLDELGLKVDEACAMLLALGIEPATYTRRQPSTGKRVDKKPALP
ncbi:MAG: histidinol-phosphatase [Firmicutes bacterium]|nr:histidinol-phosphatase [Bacillota bacterium]